jgi:ERCC4-related helicase
MLLQAVAATPHPKMSHLMEVLTNHFAAHERQQQAAAAAAAAAADARDAEDGSVPDVTRAMVFITYREQVALVWQHLKQLEPDIVCR